MEEDKNFKYIVRIANTDLDGKRPILASLRKIKGISFSFSHMLCSLSQIDGNKRTGNLSDAEIKSVEATIKKIPELAPSWLLNRRKDFETGQNLHLLGSDLDFAKDQDVRRFKRIRSYSGIRHGLKLPLRGQRTRSNFRKNKGKVMGVVKQKQQPASKKGKKD